MYSARPLRQTTDTGIGGTADAIYQNLDFLKRCHEPYVIITSGDAVYKMDYNKVLEYHIDKESGYYSGMQRSGTGRGCDPFWYGAYERESAGLKSLKRSRWWQIPRQFPPESMLSADDF